MIDIRSKFTDVQVLDMMCCPRCVAFDAQLQHEGYRYGKTFDEIARNFASHLYESHRDAMLVHSGPGAFDNASDNSTQRHAYEKVNYSQVFPQSI